MPRSGPPSYTFTLAPGYLAVPGATITSSQWNVTLQDIQTTFNLTQQIVQGGTGATSAAGARTNLGLVPGVDIPSLYSVNVWTNTNTFQLTDAGATAGPDLILDRLSASPAASDLLAQILFTGRDSGAASQTYALLRASILDATAGTEDGQFVIQTVVNGTLTTLFTLNSTGLTIVPPLVTPALGTPASGVMTNVTGTATGLTSGITNALKSATTTVDVSAATAPTANQVLRATDSTHATWQTLSTITKTKTQPTTDVSTVSLTGLSTGELVTCIAAFTLNNTSSGGARTITLSGATSGGTKRTIATLTSPSISGTGNCTVGFSAVIGGFNLAQEKSATVSWGFGADTSVLDSSNASNIMSATNGVIAAFDSWDEIWDELYIDCGSSCTIEGSTADQRGYMFAYAQ